MLLQKNSSVNDLLVQKETIGFILIQKTSVNI